MLIYNMSSAKKIIHIGADHRGYELKNALKSELHQLPDIEIIDHGAYEYYSQDDYVDFATNVSRSVNDSTEDVGILICGSGIGMGMIANNYPNVRASEVNTKQAAELDRIEHNSNILIISADKYPEIENNINHCLSVITNWLNTKTATQGRHLRRQNKINLIKKSLFEPMVVPAILETDFLTAKSQVEKFIGTSSLINLDFINNTLISGKTLKFTECVEIIEDHPQQLFSLHLMVDDNLKYLTQLIKQNITNLLYVYIQVESKDFFNVSELITSKEINFEVIPSINPDSEIIFDQLKDYLRVQLMSVAPGAQGRQFEVEKINAKLTQLLNESIHRNRYEGRVHLDGGINIDKYKYIQPFLNLIEVINVGSAISKSSNPLESYSELVKTYTKLRNHG